MVKFGFLKALTWTFLAINGNSGTFLQARAVASGAASGSADGSAEAAGSASSSASVVAGVRVRLKDEVVVRTRMVTLANLFPEVLPEASAETAGAVIRERARKVILGAAPLPGARRIFQRAEIVHAMESDAVLRKALAVRAEKGARVDRRVMGQIEVPDQVEVTRWARALNAEEVVAAVRRMLRANHFGEEDLTAQDVTFDRRIEVTEESPKVEVTRIEPARRGSGTNMRLWVRSEPGVPPFWIHVDRAIGVGELLQVASSTRLAGMTGTTTRTATTATQSASAVLQSDAEDGGPAEDARPKPAVIMKAGGPIELVIKGDGISISAAGIPLDAGRSGERVRVRMVLSGRVLMGTVVGPALVEVDY